MIKQMGETPKSTKNKYKTSVRDALESVSVDEGALNERGDTHHVIVDEEIARNEKGDIIATFTKKDEEYENTVAEDDLNRTFFSLEQEGIDTSKLKTPELLEQYKKTFGEMMRNNMEIVDGKDTLNQTKYSKEKDAFLHKLKKQARDSEKNSAMEQARGSLADAIPDETTEVENELIYTPQLESAIRKALRQSSYAAHIKKVTTGKSLIASYLVNPKEQAALKGNDVIKSKRDFRGETILNTKGLLNHSIGVGWLGFKKKTIREILEEDGQTELLATIQQYEQQKDLR